MKRRITLFTVLGLLTCFSVPARKAFAQGYGDPLAMQGVDHATLQSAASRGAGGITMGARGDVGLMFANPVSLQSLKGIQLSLGALNQSGTAKQVQQYAPLKYYSNFSILMEGLSARIPNPRYDSTGGRNAGDTVQRPFDNLGPNWSRSESRGAPIQVMLAVPFSIGETRFVAGVGAVEYACLNNYYRNNNVLSPSIGSDRPVPVELPPSDSTPVVTDWSSFVRAREGRVRGYGLALSGALSERISLGFSGMLLSGSSDDYVQSAGRGRLTFYRDTYFRLDSIYRRSTTNGTSDFKGSELTFSAVYRGPFVSLGFSVKPPTTITRTYALSTRVDSTGFFASVPRNGEDKLRFPWRGTVGVSLAPARNVVLGLEYEIRSFASAVYTNPFGVESNPWLTASQVHIGAEFTATQWLALRAGVRGQMEVFQQTGNPIPGEPVGLTIYSAGAGVALGAVRLNVAYEYASMKYTDTWQTNVNLNTQAVHTIVADVSYELPFTE